MDMGVAVKREGGVNTCTYVYTRATHTHTHHRERQRDKKICSNRVGI